MKVAIVCESDVDAAALRLLIGGILGVPAEPANNAPLSTRSWPGILEMVHTVYRGLYYGSDAEGLVLVADSDHSWPHEADRCDASSTKKKCRLCQLRLAIQAAQQHLKPRPLAFPLRSAVGLAVPEISAWYLVGLDPHVSEAAWFNALKQGTGFPYQKADLKRKAFQTEYVAPMRAIEVARQHAERLAADVHQIETMFPLGFGTLAEDLRNW